MNFVYVLKLPEWHGAEVAQVAAYSVVLQLEDALADQD